ncbi:LuxR C-terminal-related transcriptional regulator [Nocardioides sambongensis]|uniref:LuxR C-terminal-related transcriptional regulator n=1 Tax=Nocardioides sambongensis TaxID=2589074 RepID=UPI00112C20A9|nr:LuxR C-terminal-related transcriptional regulator [Nocardioides sambongensis]
MFASKLRPAVSPIHLVPRPRLDALLDEAVAAPLTLVVAPPGSGKTVLLATWTSRTALPTAWLALDEADRDPVQLWCAMAAALEQLARGCADTAVDLFRRPGGLLGGVGELLDELERRALSPRVLIVDDLHLVDEVEETAASLALFLQHLPRWLHVVLISRRRPPLPVERLRARGQVGEVHFPELRFSFDEASAMLAALAPAIEPDAAAAIATEAGGWAASIQFAALAARSARARAPEELPAPEDGLHYLDDYLWHEVLGAVREDLVEVLLATSVVKRVAPDLARILTSRADAGDLLAEAEEQGLFISRTEATGEFEIHALVRERLVDVLAKRSPDRLRELYSLAAGWDEAHGQTLLALDNWLRADRPRDALRLLAAEASTLYDDGHARVIERVLGAIPDAVADGGTEPSIEFAWCHLLVDRHRFAALVDDLSRRTQGDLGLAPLLEARIDVLRSIAAILRGDWSNGASHARSALQEVGHTWWLDPLGRFGWNLIGRDIALREVWDESSAATKEVISAVAIAPDRRLALAGTRALGEALAGRPVDALRVAAGVKEGSDATRLVILRAETMTARAIAHREIGEPAAALPLLHELVVDRLEPTAHCQLLAWLELTHARICEGSLAAADDAFGHAAELVDTELGGPGATSWLARTGTVLAVANGEIGEGEVWAARVKDPFWSVVSTARVLLASEEPGRAYDALKGAEARCQRHRVVAGLMLARATEAPAEAEQHLVDAVRIAAAHGLVQTVAAEGPAVLEQVERLTWRAPDGWLSRVRRAVAAEGVRHSPVPELVDPLTEREVQVLRMLPSRLTLREVADELCISPNTLKFHLKVIYRKLGCGSRAEAAEVARALTSLRGPGQPSRTRRR